MGQEGKNNALNDKRKAQGSMGSLRVKPPSGRGRLTPPAHPPCHHARKSSFGTKGAERKFCYKSPSSLPQKCCKAWWGVRPRTKQDGVGPPTYHKLSRFPFSPGRTSSCEPFLDRIYLLGILLLCIGICLLCRRLLVVFGGCKKRF